MMGLNGEPGTHCFSTTQALYKMTDPKKHHYVPQSLLRRFSHNNERRQIHVFDKTTRRSYLTAINNAGAENHFYSVEVGDERLVLEGLFNQIDSKTATLLDSISQSRSLARLSEDDLAFLAIIAAAQLLRVNATRDRLKEISYQLLATLDKFGVAPENPAEQVMSDAYARKATIESVFDLSFAQHFLAKDLALLSSRDLPLFISDNPVVKENHLPFGDFGLASPGIEIYLPISSELALAFFCPSIRNYLEKIAASGRPMPLLESLQDGTAAELQPQCAKFLNKLQVIQSSRYLYSAKSDFSIALDTIEEYPNLTQQSPGVLTGWDGYTFKRRMPKGTFVVAIGRTSQHMLPVVSLEENAKDCEFAFISPPSEDLTSAVTDSPFKEVAIYVDQFMRRQIRDVIFVPQENGSVCVRMRDESLHRLFRSL
jgi:hypothetical protein